jgi:hypothetical protein
MHHALIHDDRQVCLFCGYCGFFVDDSELHPHYAGLAIRIVQFDGLLHDGLDIFGSSENIDNVDFSLDFGGDVEETGVAFLFQNFISERIDGHNPVPVVPHVCGYSVARLPKHGG